jgi:hypothetical protein
MESLVMWRDTFPCRWARLSTLLRFPLDIFAYLTIYFQFHEIQAQVAVADVHGGPSLEIIVADMAGMTSS